MVDVDEVLKILGLIFGIYLWMFVIPSAFAPVLRWPPVREFASPVLVVLWLLLPFLYFLYRYHRMGYEVPYLSRVLR